MITEAEQFIDDQFSLSGTLHFPGRETAQRPVSLAPPPRPHPRTASGLHSCGPLARQARRTSARAARPLIPPIPSARIPCSQGTATRG